MTQTLKKIILVLLALLLATTYVCVTVNVKDKAYADGPVDWNLCDTDIDAYSGEYYDYRNAFSATDNFSEYPMITVLTHGMGSDASVWSNDMSENNMNNVSFAYDEFSIIERLRAKSNALGNQVVRAKISSTTNTTTDENTYSFKLIKVEGTTYETSDNNPQNIVSLNDLNYTNHLIIVYDSPITGNRSNEEDFRAFGGMLLSIIKTLKINNTYPKVNLIGHSRGGLTNLAFAMAYPELVYSLTSVGTPYFGSNFGKINYLAHVLKFENKDAFVDIQDTARQDDMVAKWNAGYLGVGNLPNGVNISDVDSIYYGLSNTIYNNITNPIYDNIELKILGGYSRINYLKSVLRNYGSLLSITQEDAEGYADMITNIQRGIYLLGTSYVAGQIRTQINQMVSADVDLDESYMVQKSEIEQVLEEAIRNNENGNDESSLFLYDDLFVSLNSQFGRKYNNEEESYAGFSDHRHAKYFSDITNIQSYKFAQSEVPIVHNLETRDPFFVNEIVYGMGNARGDDVNTYEIDDPTDMGIVMGAYIDGTNTNMINVANDGTAIMSEVVIVRSNMGPTVLTDDGYMANDYDEIDLDWFFGQCSINLDYTNLSSQYNKIEINLSGDVKEGDDGYQWVGLFNTSATSTNDKIAEYRTEHSLDGKDTTWSYTLNVNFDTFISYFSDGVIVLRYTGSGKYDDDWYCRNIKMSIRIYQSNN